MNTRPVRVAVALTLALGFAGLPEAGFAQELPASATEVHPLLIGAAAPDAPLVAIGGGVTTLREALGGSPAVIIFYRGEW